MYNLFNNNSTVFTEQNVYFTLVLIMPKCVFCSVKTNNSVQN